jgi:predicted CopG family antitoxin
MMTDNDMEFSDVMNELVQRREQVRLLTADLQDAIEENALTRKALEQYANRDHWINGGDEWKLSFDGSEVARQALGMEGEQK